MNEIQRLQQLAGIIVETNDEGSYGIAIDGKVVYKGFSKEEAYSWMETDGMGGEKIVRKHDGKWYPISGGDPVNENFDEAETGDEVEKTVIGHEDSESEAMRKDLYQMGKYCVELYKMMGSMPDADYPHWLQSKLVKAKDYISTVKHYIDNETNAPQDDYAEPAIVTPDAEDYSDPSGVS